MTAPVTASFVLVDHHGRPVTEATFRGRWLLVFFGFTHCRMVCPRALAKLTGVIADLGAAGETLQPLYITVDPDRDSPERMRDFLSVTAPAFLGLTGSVEQVEAAKHSFGVFARRRPARLPADPGEYDVPHTAFTYLIDPQGRYARHWGDAAEQEAITAGLRSALRQAADGHPPSPEFPAGDASGGAPL